MTNTLTIEVQEREMQSANAIAKRIEAIGHGKDMAKDALGYIANAKTLEYQITPIQNKRFREQRGYKLELKAKLRFTPSWDGTRCISNMFMDHYEQPGSHAYPVYGEASWMPEGIKKVMILSDAYKKQARFDESLALLQGALEGVITNQVVIVPQNGIGVYNTLLDQIKTRALRGLASIDKVRHNELARDYLTLAKHCETETIKEN